MLVIPGGGFYAVATDLEGTEICDWVVRQGMTCAMLKYRTPQVWPRVDGRQQRPGILLGLEDAQRAMGLLRERASAYGIDPHRIGAIGFSAGAYLVANMSNTDARTYPLRDAADRLSPRPDFAIVAYTARMLDDSKGRNSLELRPWVKISPKAPPTLIIHAMNDPTDNIRQPMAYALALNDAGCRSTCGFMPKEAMRSGCGRTMLRSHGNGRGRPCNGCAIPGCYRQKLWRDAACRSTGRNPACPTRPHGLALAA
ncbi:alpha/beta hydrolase [Sphingomonas sp. I4]